MDIENMIRLATRQLCILLLLMLGGGAASAADREIWRPAEGQPLRWKALLVAGDMEDGAFYNGVHALAHMLEAGGVQKQDIVILTPYASEYYGKPEFAVMKSHLESFAVKPGDACLVYLTSHGNQGGIRLRGRNAYVTLSPSALEGLIETGCKQAPTMVVVSACYSGVFVPEGGPPSNRVIFTAARPDRPSFGCNAQLELTYFDFCLLASLPGSTDWQQIASRSRKCVDKREAVIRATPSEPRFAVSEAMKSIAPPPVPANAYLALWQIVPQQLDKANSIPFGGREGKEWLAKYKKESGAKALAVGPMGGWAWRAAADVETARQEALAACRKNAGSECLLYAAENELIWHDSVRAALPTAQAFFQRLGLSD